jgi:hypothetical protein
MRTFFILPILLLAAAVARAEDPLVVLAAARTGHIEFFDASLSPLGAIGVNQLVESVTASPDGRRLYIAQENLYSVPGACCGLFSLDMETHNMCFLAAPALFGTPSADGRFLFTQGDGGVDLFDARTLGRLPTMKAPGAYNLQPSPDGRWLLGVTNSPKPSLDIFDMKSRMLARQLPMPAGPVTGAWARDRFYLFNYSFEGVPEKGWLWSVKPEDGQLSAARPINLPDLHGACKQPVLLMLAGAPDKLFLAEAFGFKMDRRRACPDLPMGGIYAIQPSTGQVSKIAEAVHVNRMAVTPDGHDLYVLQSTWRNRRREAGLLRIDVRTGLVTNNTLLERGDWNLALAHIPPALIPRGTVRASSYCSR